MHGHSFKVEISVEGEVDPKIGWVYDHAEITQAMEPLMEKLDHSYLNEIEGLEKPHHRAHGRVALAHAGSAAPGSLRIVIHETPSARCVFFAASFEHYRPATFALRPWQGSLTFPPLHEDQDCCRSFRPCRDAHHFLRAAQVEVRPTNFSRATKKHGEAHGKTGEPGDAGAPVEKAKDHETAKHE